MPPPAGTGRRGGGNDADRLQHAEDAEAGYLAGELGLVPGEGDEAYGRQVVDLVGLDLLYGGDEGGLVEEVAELDLHVGQDGLDDLPLGVILASDEPVDRVALG